MKIFTLRNILGLAAIGGAYAYVKKHGGVQKAFDHLKTQTNELLAKARETNAATKPPSAPMNTGYSSTTYERH